MSANMVRCDGIDCGEFRNGTIWNGWFAVERGGGVFGPKRFDFHSSRCLEIWARTRDIEDATKAAAKRAAK